MSSDSVKLYGLIYVALIGLATSKFAFFHLEFFGYWDAVGATLLAASLKTGLIVAYYQHLRWENRSLAGLMALALTLFVLLMAAASFSIS
ncbi:MAG: cytochrome c oxidase subunit 4 [Natronomonas sp.]|jgi:cytochrome c oxidase subunit 4|uniref:cytochrome C oxidase subunit IV family protein n=1 Tax=Natronomonas sp. TaxID=2184060 RepID=UPI003988D514